MKRTNSTPSEKWTVMRAILLGAICLTAGIAGGWSIRASQGPAAPGAAPPASASASLGDVSGPVSQASTPAQLKEMADAQAAPLLAKLKSDANDPELLTSLGNLYYDAQQYPVAIDYYARTLKTRPSDAAVRTDMATAYWYLGNADTAIAEFDKALTYAPNNPNTLFNRGLVKWKGKRDAAGAIADFQKLLAANPNYGGKDKVEQIMAEAKQSAGEHESAAK
jgi:tetratricopeptide (TPR) repeat protein